MGARGPKPTLLDSVWELLRKKSCVIRLNQNFYVDYMGFIYWISGFIQTRHVEEPTSHPRGTGGTCFCLQIETQMSHEALVCSPSRKFRVYWPFFRITRGNIACDICTLTLLSTKVPHNLEILAYTLYFAVLHMINPCIVYDMFLAVKLLHCDLWDDILLKFQNIYCHNNSVCNSHAIPLYGPGGS